MNPATLKPRHVLILAAVALTACQQNKTPEAAATTQAVPDAKPGVTVSGGVLVLPAVKGNPGAVYFDVTNGGTAAATLAAVSVQGADKAEMHETKGGSMAPLKDVALQPGETVRFERGGKHVMVFGIGHAVTAGGTTEMTLTFAGGDKVSVPLKIQAISGTSISGTMNAGVETMPGMGHGGDD
jgi:copper(I)-binding protein